jgi:predicted DCC family thiol-disulfide oxidoreductase YuxK
MKLGENRVSLNRQGMMRMNDKQPQATILYDGACGLCSASARRLERFCRRHNFDLLPLQAQDAQSISGLSEGQLMEGLTVVLPDNGGAFQGIAGFIEVGKRVWYLRPFAYLVAVPGIRHAFELAYRPVVHYRRRISTVCKLRPDL